jgi:hypothetical protein
MIAESGTIVVYKFSAFISRHIPEPTIIPIIFSSAPFIYGIGAVFVKKFIVVKHAVSDVHFVFVAKFSYVCGANIGEGIFDIVNVCKPGCGNESD